MWLTYLAGARFFNRNVGLLAAAIFGLAFLPIFYSHLALNDVPTLAPVALSLYGTALRDAPRAPARLRDRRGRASASRPRPSTPAGSRCCACWRRSSATPPAARFWARRAGSRSALVVALIAFVIANPYSVLDFHSFTTGVSSQASLAAGQDPVKLGTQARQRHRLLPVDVHLGPRLGAGAGRDRRRGPAARPPPARDGARADAGADRVHHLHGQPAALLRPLADADLPDRRDPRRLRRGRAGRLADPCAAGSRRPRRPALVAVLLLAQSLVAVLHDDAVLSRPDTRNLARAWMVGARPGRLEGRDRAGRRRQLGHRRRHLAAVDAERRSLVPLRDLADRRRRERQPAAARRSGATCSSTSTSARCGPRCSTSTSPAATAGCDRLRAGRPRVRPAAARARPRSPTTPRSPAAPGSSTTSARSQPEPTRCRSASTGRSTTTRASTGGRARS